MTNNPVADLVEDDVQLEIDRHMLMSMATSFRAEMDFSFSGKDMADLLDRCADKMTATPTSAEPVAVRHSFDGYGWQYADQGNGSDWLARALAKPDAQPIYTHPTPMTVEASAVDALAAYQQADMDGTMVLVSRQAIEECLPALRALSGEKS